MLTPHLKTVTVDVGHLQLQLVVNVFNEKYLTRTQVFETCADLRQTLLEGLDANLVLLQCS